MLRRRYQSIFKAQFRLERNQNLSKFELFWALVLCLACHIQSYLDFFTPNVPGQIMSGHEIESLR